MTKILTESVTLYLEPQFLREIHTHSLLDNVKPAGLIFFDPMFKSIRFDKRGRFRYNYVLTWINSEESNEGFNKVSSSSILKSYYLICRNVGMNIYQAKNFFYIIGLFDNFIKSVLFHKHDYNKVNTKTEFLLDVLINAFKLAENLFNDNNYENVHEGSCVVFKRKGSVDKRGDQHFSFKLVWLDPNRKDIYGKNIINNVILIPDSLHFKNTYPNKDKFAKYFKYLHTSRFTLLYTSLFTEAVNDAINYHVKRKTDLYHLLANEHTVDDLQAYFDKISIVGRRTTYDRQVAQAYKKIALLSLHFLTTYTNIKPTKIPHLLFETFRLTGLSSHFFITKNGSSEKLKSKTRRLRIRNLDDMIQYLKGIKRTGKSS